VPHRSGLVAALLWILPGVLPAQFETGVLSGRVLARVDSTTTAPASGATVRVSGSSLMTRTGPDGRYHLPDVPAGPVVLQVRLLGFATAERSIRVGRGDTTTVDVVLEPEARMLAPIRSDALAADLERFMTKPTVASVSLTAEAIRGVPRVGEPDVVRVAQLLPGVVARNDFNTGLNVRGGEADQNLVLLDGYPIYNPFHLGGLFSTFMDATVGGIELMTAAFPARYGGRLSSVLDVRSADESRPGLNGVAEVSVLGASARVGSLVREGRGSWSIAARRTYADAATRIFTDDVFPYHFRDVHGRLTYTFPRDVRVAITAYAGRDVLDANFAEYASDSTPSRANQGQWSFQWGNRVVGATIQKDVGAVQLEQRISTSAFSTDLDVGSGAIGQTNAIRDVRVAGSVQSRGRTHDPSAGYELVGHRVHYFSGSAATGTNEFDFVQRPTTAALWFSDLWRVTPRILTRSCLVPRGQVPTAVAVRAAREMN